MGAFEAAVEHYRLYLAGAPKDERRVPEAWYGLAVCLFTHSRAAAKAGRKAVGGRQDNDDGLRQAAECYNKGLEAEGNRLPAWGPVTAQSKGLLAMMPRGSSKAKTAGELSVETEGSSTLTLTRRARRAY